MAPTTTTILDEVQNEVTPTEQKQEANSTLSCTNMQAQIDLLKQQLKEVQNANKLLLNNTLFTKVAKFACFDSLNFYLRTPLDRPEYTRINVWDIVEEFYQEYGTVDCELMTGSNLSTRDDGRLIQGTAITKKRFTWPGLSLLAT